MLYRDFGATGLRHSALGFGCMRLPYDEGDQSKIRESEAIDMIRRAIDEGVTYVDTAYGYHGGQSEVLVGKALRNGYRDKVTLADKLPVWLAEKPADFERLFSEQLQRLGEDHVDLYLLHSLSRDSWRRARDIGVLDFIVKEKERGRVGRLGFSFHDSYEVFTEIVDAFDWEFCQIMFSYIDTDYQAGEAGLRYAADKGLAVVVMEPLRGGKLVTGLPAEVETAFRELHPEWSAAEWALRAVFDRPEVSVVLSGMSSMSQVEENLRIASEAGEGNLGEAERHALARAKEVFMQRIRVGCTDCRYCQPCPYGVAIPSVFSMYNNAYLFGDMQALGRQYAGLMKAEKDASRCAECGQCESVCPQNLEIISLLKQVHAEAAPASQE